MAHAIEFRNVKKGFNGSGYNALDNLSLTVDEGEFITILGTSGCGKTTLLKMINRLIEPDEGSILLFGQDIRAADVIKVRRGIGYVIQQVGLFPHMTIAENIATVPKLLKWGRQETAARIDELLALVGLPPAEYRDRYPSQLSGGQQQRVGLARAMAASPRIMLLDEPFGAIDSITRLNLQEELMQIHDSLKKTFLFVTHDIDEAFKLGTRVMIMNEGRIVQFDTPDRIIRTPADGFVDSLIRSAREREQFWRRFA